MFQNTIEKHLPQLFELGIDFTKGSLRIVLIIIAAYIGVRLLRLGKNRLEMILAREGVPSERIPGGTAMRVRTLLNVLWTIAIGLIWFIAVVSVLGEIGVNVAPVLASAGVIGLVVGFGAQSLVKDLVSGFFLILENQVRVGDIAVINGTGGRVESITFRTVVLRDLSAVVHVFPNGSINTLANLTKDWSAYVIDVKVAYNQDIDRVVDVMRRVADEMLAEPQYGSSMREPIEIFGLDGVADSAVTVKARLKTLPFQQFTIGREYRRRLKKAFEAEKVEMPTAQIVVSAAQSASFQLAIKELPQALAASR